MLEGSIFLSVFRCFHVLICKHSCIHLLYFQVPGQQALSLGYSALDVDWGSLCIALPPFSPLHFN